MQSISILGCGWLGLPLAKRLIQEGFDVKGSTTSPKKIEELKSSHIKPYLLDYQPRCDNDALDFFQSDVLFLNIPFRRTLANPSYYLDQIKAVITDTRAGSIQSVIFASSTSIYAEEIKKASEESELILNNERRRVLHEVEQSLLKQSHFAATIIRFGGLVGGHRQMGRFLAGKKDLKDPHKPVNLIHLDDCIEIVLRIIERKIYGEIFNAVCDGHPKRGELYKKAALKMNDPPPEFIAEKTHASYKVVMNEKLKSTLNYQFIHPDPDEFI